MSTTTVGAQRSWRYEQHNGIISDPDGVPIEAGYSGAQPYVNKPTAMWRENEGPIPRGKYTIEPAYDHEHLGPCSLPLTPDAGNSMFGRSDFFIHGDSDTMDQTASEGCIIMSRTTRDMIEASTTRLLTVVV